jgi:hypothetical protein
MKSLRRFCATLVLTLLLSTAALADGIMYPADVPPPPPPPPDRSWTGIMYPAVSGSTVEDSNDDATIDLATEFALSLAQNLLKLF